MPERATVLSRSEKSAEVIVAASMGRRAEREGESNAMSLAMQGIRSPGNRGEQSEGKVKPDLKHFVMKQGWRGMNRKARGELTCLGRCLREGA